MAPLHGNPPPEVRQNPPAGPREDCRRCHACGHRIGAGGFGLPPLLFCCVGLQGIFPARLNRLLLPNPKRSGLCQGGLSATDRFCNVTSLLHFFSRALGTVPGFGGEMYKFFSTIARTYVLIRLKKYKKLQKPVLLWVFPFFAYNGPLLPDFGIFRRFPLPFDLLSAVRGRGWRAGFLPVPGFEIHQPNVKIRAEGKSI